MDKDILYTRTKKISAYAAVCGGLFCSGIPSVQAYPTDFTLSVDKYYSPYMGSDLMIAGLRGYQSLDDSMASGTQCDTSNCMTMIRGGKWLFEFALSNFAMVLQHEIFGHGARLREYKVGDISYHFGILHGSTDFPYSSFLPLNNNQKAEYYAGGVEATSVLAKEIERGWMITGELDSREATMYLVNTLDSATYAFATNTSAFHPDDDALNYINYVNAWYANNNALTTKKFKTAMIWNWVNPMIYISGFSIINYIWFGQTTCPYSTLHINDMRFMPTTRTLLAPYGPEYQLLVNLFTPDDQYIGVYFRYGHTSGKVSWGLDLAVAPMAQYDCWYIENTLSVWNQPHLLQPGTALTNTNKYGFGDFLNVYYRLNRNVYAKGEIGYKLSGYQIGRQLSKGLYLGVGLRIDIGIAGKFIS